MNVAPELLSFMQSFEPERTHQLTDEELRRYGLSEEDPIAQEQRVADVASLWGITSMQYRERLLLRDESCRTWSPESLLHMNNKENDELYKAGMPSPDALDTNFKRHRARETDFGTKYERCSMRVLSGLEDSVVRARLSMADQICGKRSNDPSNNRCRVRVVRTGK
jgi:hypothetical protein